MRNSLLIIFTTMASAVIAQSFTRIPARHETNWLRNQQIIFSYDADSVNFNPELKNGDLWYFSHTYRAEEYLEVSDDELTETFGWQLKPTNSRRVMLKDEQIANAMGYFMKGCFCTDRGFHKVTKGTIEMRRLSNGWWRVNFDFVIKSKEGSMDIVVKRTNVLFKLNN
jgi:hypothetical protein